MNICQIIRPLGQLNAMQLKEYQQRSQKARRKSQFGVVENYNYHTIRCLNNGPERALTTLDWTLK